MEPDYSNLEILPEEVDFIIYHGRCSDGFGSALASYIYFKNVDSVGKNGINKNGVKVEYFAAGFNKPPPDVTNRNVLICDFSYKFDVLTKMISVAKKLAVIDHHKTAEAELKLLSDKYKIFRMDHSGAYLTWKYFFPDQDVPLLVKYIEDNDIWIKKMPYTKEVTSYIFSLPFEFEEYAKLLDDDYIEKNVIPVSLGMGKQNTHYIDQSLQFSTQKFIKMGDSYYFYVHLNTTVLKSEIGNQIFAKYPNADFSAVYSIKDNNASFSLRSTNDRADVSAIALKFGGGGHRNASGLTTFGTTELPAKLIDNNVMYKLLQNIYSVLHIVKDKPIKIVYMNCANYKKHIGRYLLQTRTIETTKNKHDVDYERPVQEACSIIRNRLNDKTYYDMFDFSCIWNYDGSTGKTWFDLQWTNASEIVNDILKVFEQSPDYVLCERKDRAIFTSFGISATLLL